MNKWTYKLEMHKANISSNGINGKVGLHGGSNLIYNASAGHQNGNFLSPVQAEPQR